MGESEKTDEIGWIVHICPRDEWERSAGHYRPESLRAEGFIHFSYPEQALETANHFYPGQTGLLLLWVNPAHLQSELRRELSDGRFYPHLYGPLNTAAVFVVREFPPDEDGKFRELPEPGL